MKKIISLFQRNYDGDRLVRDEVVPGAEWVIMPWLFMKQTYEGAVKFMDNRSIIKLE